MRIFIAILAGVVLLAATGGALIQVPRAPGRDLAELAPAGPLLVLQARDFASLLRDWNNSQEKKIWLESDTLRAFQQSRLHLRLDEAYQEFESAAGFSPGMSMLEQVAGDNAILALYDIGKLEFLYLTRLPSARAVESVLWSSRGNYEPRNAAGLPYFVKVDPATRRTAAFASTDDYLAIATREDLLAGALSLIAGQTQGSVTTDAWFEQSVRAAGQAGDLRLVLNFEALGRSPYFRSYWVQRNVAQLKQYQAGVSDIHRGAKEIREERVFLRSQPAAANAAPAVLGEILRLIPEDAGLYRAWAQPPVETALDLLERKLLAPRTGPPEPSKSAPAVWLSQGIVGSEADLEVRIDEEPPARATATFAPEALRKILQGTGLEAALQLQSSRVLDGNVYVTNQSAVVLLGSADWDGSAARAALLDAVEGLWTASRLSLRWAERRRNAQEYHEIDGLARLAVAARGRLLFVSDSADALLALVERLSSPALPVTGTYAAGFRHARERVNFEKMMRLIDYPSVQPPAPGASPEARAPHFFSENLAGLSRALARVESASIVAQDAGPLVKQTVTYRLSQ